jgi:hypothetical protein
LTRHETVSFAHLFRIVREFGLNLAVFNHGYMPVVTTLMRNMLLATCNRFDSTARRARPWCIWGRAVQLAVVSAGTGFVSGQRATVDLSGFFSAMFSCLFC